MSKGNKIIISCAAAISLAVIVYAVVSNTKKIESNTPGKYDNFAQCLTDMGAVMYGAVWCSHCIEQKAEFGDSFKYVKYIECPDNTQFCIDKGIQGFPTWLIGTSTKLEGYEKNKTMQELSDATGCTLPQ